LSELTLVGTRLIGTLGVSAMPTSPLSL
jgi:hypothetical protein